MVGGFGRPLAGGSRRALGWRLLAIGPGCRLVFAVSADRDVATYHASMGANQADRPCGLH
jgi:hypothetical protein